MPATRDLEGSWMPLQSSDQLQKRSISNGSTLKSPDVPASLSRQPLGNLTPANDFATNSRLHQHSSASSFEFAYSKTITHDTSIHHSTVRASPDTLQSKKRKLMSKSPTRQKSTPVVSPTKVSRKIPSGQTPKSFLRERFLEPSSAPSTIPASWQFDIFADDTEYDAADDWDSASSDEKENADPCSLPSKQTISQDKNLTWREQLGIFKREPLMELDPALVPGYIGGDDDEGVFVIDDEDFDRPVRPKLQSPRSHPYISLCKTGLR